VDEVRIIIEIIYVLFDASTELGREVAEANPFRYVGKLGTQYGEDTELYFMGWRDYDAKIGRFLVRMNRKGKILTLFPLTVTYMQNPIQSIISIQMGTRRNG